MSDWELTKGLQNLRSQVNVAFPNRDHESDGTIGDAAHQAETSGHNPDDTVGSTPAWDGDSDNKPEVRAWDQDSDLGMPGVTAQNEVDHIRALPNLASVLRYMIYNRKMYHSRDGFAPTAYTGSSAHTEHIHFEGAQTNAADANTSFDFKLEELVSITDDDVRGKILACDAITNPSQRSDASTNATTTWGYAVGDTWKQVYNLRDNLNAKFGTLNTQIAALNTQLVAILAAANDDADESVIVAGVLAGLTPQVLAQLPTDLVQQIATATADEAARRLTS